MLKNKITLTQKTKPTLDLAKFVKGAFSIISPGDEYLHNWHIDLITNKLEQVRNGNINRLIINMPPRYLKSICINVAWPAWLIGHQPSARIMSASYSQGLSNKHSQDCRLVLNSQWYKKLFPKVKIAKGENQKAKFVTTKRGFRLATSTGGIATGEGGDYLIVDDPQNPSKINSKKYRDTTIEWFEQTFISRLNNKKTGAIVIVMQRLHAGDLCGYLLENKAKQWDLLKLPAIYEQKTIYSFPYKIIINTNDVLHKERENIEDLSKIKLELGAYNFAAQYNQEPIPNIGAMIQKSWIKHYSLNELDKIEFLQIIQSWDTAIKAKNESDYSVGITIGINNNGYYLLDLQKDRVEFPELIKMFQSQVCKWQPQVILVEDQASGQSLIQVAKTTINIPIIAIKPKFDKVSRFAAITPLFEVGKIFLPIEAHWRITFEQEILTFPKAPNDDQVDALSQALTYLTKNKASRVIRKL